MMRKRGWFVPGFCISSWVALGTGCASQVDWASWDSSTEGGTIRLLEESDSTSSKPASHRSGRLLFESNRAGNPDVWMLQSTESRGARQLTTDAGPDRSPSFHPNGQNFFFLSDRAGDGASYFMGTIGKPIAKLVVNAMKPTIGIWAPGFVDPSGSTFVYAAGNSIWLVELENGARTQLIEGSQPHWHPDGERILLRRKARDFGRYVSTSLWITTKDGSDVSEVIPGSDDISISEGRFSPDGRRICYTRTMMSSYGRTSVDTNIWVARNDGTDQFALTSAPGGDDECAWLDAQRIVFSSNRPTSGAADVGSWNLWIATIDDARDSRPSGVSPPAREEPADEGGTPASEGASADHVR